MRHPPSARRTPHHRRRRQWPPERRSRRSISRKLPPIELITAETDIRAFLAPGVPAEREACGASPRVGRRSQESGILSGSNDYDFDFHTPGAIPGFGSLEMTDELRREAVRIVSGWQPEPEAIPPTASAVTAAAFGACGFISATYGGD